MLIVHIKRNSLSLDRAGDITSRLSADTTTVSDQICLNINVVVRSLTQAAMVLVFMFHASWRLTVITFIMLPATISICRVYGAYFRSTTAASAVVLSSTWAGVHVLKGGIHLSPIHDSWSALAGNCPRRCKQNWQRQTVWLRRCCPACRQ